MKPTTYPEKHSLVTEAYWYQPLEYDLSNRHLLAQFDGNGGISKYSTAGEWSILAENSWFTGWSVNGQRLSGTHCKTVSVMGRMMNIDFHSTKELDGVSVRVCQYCGDTDNSLYIRFEFENNGAEPAQVFLRQGMEWDIDSYISAMVSSRGMYQSQEINYSWNSSRSICQAVFGEEYIVHLASSHPVSRLEKKGTKMILDFKDQIGPGETAVMTLSISGGKHPEKPQNMLDRADLLMAEAKSYNQWLKSSFSSDNELLNALFSSCLNAAHSSYKESGDRFAGFYAGINYQSPSRTYYRDGYWTVLPILPFNPSLVRNEILTLAQGIREDGSCPSAVIYNILNEQFEPFWPDHYDSPSFFVLMVHDYLAWTHDRKLLEYSIQGRSIFDLVSLCIQKLQGFTDEQLQLFVKPENRRDWCDNVVRQGLVTYDILLHIRAQECFIEILRFIGEEKQVLPVERKMKAAIQSLRELWSEDKGYYNYIHTQEDGLEEDNISIEQTLAAVFNIGSVTQQKQLLDIITERLETLNNPDQPYGDWGVMTCFPSYHHVHHLVEKSAYPFRYHNGSDWPYWSGLLAWAKLRHNRTDWEYPLTRWFTYALERQWLTPVEYYDPVFGKGSNLQGWSSMSAAAMLYGGLGLWPSLNGDFSLKTPPWGDCIVKGIAFRGKRYNYRAENGRIFFELQSLQ